MRSDSTTDTEKLPLELDGIIFDLQKFGGITEYWREISTRLQARAELSVSTCSAPSWRRFVKVNSQARVFHSSYFRIARGRNVRNVVSVYDMAFERGLFGHGLRNRLACLERRQAYFAADAIICISAHTRRDLIEHYPALEQRCPIEVIYFGSTLAADAVGAPKEQIQTSLDTPYMLFVGKREHYKNFEGALSGFAQSKLALDGFRLICTGSPFSEIETALIARHGLTDQVSCLGAVDRAELATLYRHAFCLLYPSRFEGFGLPVLEAMTLGCPVVASDCTSIPEVAGDAALLVPDGEPGGLASALVKLSDPDFRQRMVLAGLQQSRTFYWERTADAHAAIYRSLA